ESARAPGPAPAWRPRPAASLSRSVPPARERLPRPVRPAPWRAGGTRHLAGPAPAAPPKAPAARPPMPSARADPRSAVSRRAMLGQSRPLIAKIHELQVDPEVVLAHQRDGRLQGVAVFPGHPQLVVLDLRLDLDLAVLDRADDLLGRLGLDPLL